MLYRDHKEYARTLSNQDLEILRTWLRGESDDRSLKVWLGSMYS